MAPTERIEARMPRAQKKLIEQAAELAGLSVTGFIVSSAVQQAQLVIEQHSRTTLSLANARRLTEILADDKPNEAMLAAAKRYPGRRARR